MIIIISLYRWYESLIDRTKGAVSIVLLVPLLIVGLTSLRDSYIGTAICLVSILFFVVTAIMLVNKTFRSM